MKVGLTLNIVRASLELRRQCALSLVSYCVDRRIVVAGARNCVRVRDRSLLVRHVYLPIVLVANSEAVEASLRGARQLLIANIKVGC